MPSSRVVLPSFVLLLLAACGSRSGMDLPATSTSGGGAAGSTATPTTVTSTGGAAGSTATPTTVTSTGGATGEGGTTSTGGAMLCSTIAVQPPYVVNPEAQAHKPRIAALSGTNDVLLGFVSGDPPDEILHFSRLQDPWSSWPPQGQGMLDKLSYLAGDYVMGAGAGGPLVLLHGPGQTPWLLEFDGLSTTLELLSNLEPGEPLYVTGIPGRVLAAEALTFPNYSDLSIVSLQPPSSSQFEQPQICVTSRVLAAAVPSGAGFLSAIAEVDPPSDDCVLAPKKATRVSMKRYESPPEFGSALELTDGDAVSNAEPVQLLAMAPASFGGWVVYQTDGSASLQMPAIVAIPVDGKGHLLPGASPFPVSADGVSWPYLAAATLDGDVLAAAHVDALDPSAPTIVIQLATKGGALGPAIAIPTNEAWLTGRIELLSSPDGRSLLVAWEAGQNEQRIALTRVDCIAAP